MRASQFHLSTTKETPAAAELVSHQLMLRAGMIRQIAAGLYSWMPLGLRVLRRAEAVIREEMDRSGALELLMPMVQPGELWRESGRWDAYGPELLRFTDRHDRDFCLGPTHEEIITELFRREIRSHRQLPINLYQIQTKFRDEVRPRFGVMRAREFVMKDAYSFHLTEESLAETYEAMVEAYRRIFERLGLDFRAVQADTGAMGGKLSHEFHVLASSGEDAIAYSTESDYAANVELAEAVPPSGARPGASRQAERGQGPPSSAAERSSRVQIHLVRGSADDIVALVLRADHTLNELKASRLGAVADPLEPISKEEAERELGASAETIDLTRLATTIIADHAAAHLADFACPAGTDSHWLGMNWGRDLDEPQTADLREVEAGDPSPDGRGKLEIARGIEVGHIFQLGDKYSTDMDARVADESGREQLVTMGCYGIGVSRVIAAAIEQNHDDRGIIWPQALAPFDIALLPMNAAKSERVRETTERLYSELADAGLEVLLDDRGLRPGVMFSDMELIGIPHRLVVGERGLESGSVEYQARGAETAEPIAAESAADELRRRLKLRT